MVWEHGQDWTHTVGGRNVSHYHRVPFTGLSMDHCYLKVDMESMLDNSTASCYSTAESIIGGLGATFEGIAGTFLNALVILALLKNASLRKEYLTPSIVSLATTDLLFSMVTLPMVAIRYFVQYVFYTNIVIITLLLIIGF